MSTKESVKDAEKAADNKRALEEMRARDSPQQSRARGHKPNQGHRAHRLVDALSVPGDALYAPQQSRSRGTPLPRDTYSQRNSKIDTVNEGFGGGKRYRTKRSKTKRSKTKRYRTKRSRTKRSRTKRSRTNRSRTKRR